MNFPKNQRRGDLDKRRIIGSWRMAASTVAVPLADQPIGMPKGVIRRLRQCAD